MLESGTPGLTRRGEEPWLGARLRHRQAAEAARESGRRTATPSRYGKCASPRPYLRGPGGEIPPGDPTRDDLCRGTTRTATKSSGLSNRPNEH